MLSRIMRPSAVPVFLAARGGDISRSVADVTLAKHLLDYEEKVELRVGLKTLAVS
jgi:nucleoside-diphosphate-sugar epimerase